MTEAEAVATLERWLAALEDIHSDIKQLQVTVYGGDNDCSV